MSPTLVLCLQMCHCGTTLTLDATLLRCLWCVTVAPSHCQTIKCSAYLQGRRRQATDCQFYNLNQFWIYHRGIDAMHCLRAKRRRTVRALRTSILRVWLSRSPAPVQIQPCTVIHCSVGPGNHCHHDRWCQCDWGHHSRRLWSYTESLHRDTVEMAQSNE